MGNCPSKGSSRPTTHDLRRAPHKTKNSAGRNRRRSRSPPSPAPRPATAAAPARHRQHNIPANLPRKPRFIEDLDSPEEDSYPDPPPPAPSPPPAVVHFQPQAPPSPPPEYEDTALPQGVGTIYPRPTRVREPHQQGWLPSGHTPASAGGGGGGGLHRSGAVRGRRPDLLQPRERPKKKSPERKPSSLAKAATTHRRTPPPVRRRTPPPLSRANSIRGGAPSGGGGRNAQVQAPVPRMTRAVMLSRAATAARSSGGGDASSPSRAPQPPPKRAKPAVKGNRLGPWDFDRREADHPGSTAGLPRLAEFSKMGVKPPLPVGEEEEEEDDDDYEGERGREEEEEEQPFQEAPMPGPGLKRQPAVHHRVNPYKAAALASERAAQAAARKGVPITYVGSAKDYYASLSRK